VLAPHRDDLLAIGELVRERLDPGVPNPPELVATVLQDIGKMRFLVHVLRVPRSKQFEGCRPEPQASVLQYVSAAART
jgi:hypothetical protein